jgi:glutamate carboxypeptidase
MSTIPAPVMLARLQQAVEQMLPAFLVDLERLINIESGTYTKPGVDAVATWMADQLAALGATIERHVNSELGDTIVATLESAVERPVVMLIGHADTVFEPGYLARRPFEIRGNEILGPGASDMKSGLLLGLYALKALRAISPDDEDWLPVGRVVYVINTDEEIGSNLSTPVIESLARSADVAFVLEAARANGDIVSERKSMLHLRATISGVASHAGVEPEKGRSAVLEAAHKTVALHALNDRWPSVTVNVGRLAGGTRPNIVADEAVMLIDMRAATLREHEEAESAIRDILAASTVADTTTSVEQTAQHLPMEKTPMSARLVDEAVAIAAAIGFELRDTATGGGSDANTTAAVGVPTIDGLGPIGGNDHTPRERLMVDSIVPRTTLLAGLLLAQGQH